MEFMPGLFKMLAVTGILYGYFRLFLQDRPHHQYNRIFLLGTIACSLVIPFLHISIPIPVSHQIQRIVVDYLPLQKGEMGEQDPLGVGTTNRIPITLESAMLLIYISGMMAVIGKFVLKLIEIRKLQQQARLINHAGIPLYYTNHPGAPFNFLDKIFWSPQHNPDSFEGRKILRHELYHSRQKHGWDLLFIEIILALCWFNPFYYLLRKELMLVHEYAADAASVGTGEEIVYAEILLQQQIQRKKNSLLLQFYHQPLKRRLFMLLRKNQPLKANIQARIFAIPVLITILGLMAFKIAPDRAGRMNALNKKSVTIVIDAGHGGADGGAMANGIQEKDINLAIAKSMAALAANYQLNVVLTRATDDLPGRSASISEALKIRSDLGNQSNAVLFVSLHVNYSQTTDIKGELYISARTSDAALLESSRKAGSIIIGSLNKVIETRPEIVQRKNQGIWVLDKSSIPAVLVEMGNMNNPKDLSFITNPANQEKIAQALLEGIQAYVGEL